MTIDFLSEKAMRFTNKYNQATRGEKQELFYGLTISQILDLCYKKTNTRHLKELCKFISRDGVHHVLAAHLSRAINKNLGLMNIAHMLKTQIIDIEPKIYQSPNIAMRCRKKSPPLTPELQKKILEAFEAGNKQQLEKLLTLRTFYDVKKDLMEAVKNLKEDMPLNSHVKAQELLTEISKYIYNDTKF